MRPKLRTVGCFVEYEGKFVILHRHPDKSHGNTWGLPAGKLDKGETDLEAVVREVYEETGIKAEPSTFTLLGIYEFDFPDVLLTFPTFKIDLIEPPELSMSTNEHQDYKWVTGEECYKMPDLIEGLHDLLIMTGHAKK